MTATTGPTKVSTVAARSRRAIDGLLLVAALLIAVSWWAG
jgi:hypothetical protein